MFLKEYNRRCRIKDPTFPAWSMRKKLLPPHTFLALAYRKGITLVQVDCPVCFGRHAHKIRPGGGQFESCGDRTYLIVYVRSKL